MEGKFRGKRLDTGKWIYGFFLKNRDKTYIAYYDSVEQYRPHKILVDSKTVEQYKNPAFVTCTKPSNDAKDDAEMYCGECDELIEDEDWNHCPSCGVKLLIHGRDI